MLVDVDKRVVAFDLDGRVQGACEIPGEKPLYVITQMDPRRVFERFCSFPKPVDLQVLPSL